MHIHKIKFGKYVKLLLRESYKANGHVRKYTIANLSSWTQEQINQLELALKAKRICRGADLEEAAHRNILGILIGYGCEPWRLYQTPIDKFTR